MTITEGHLNDIRHRRDAARAYRQWLTTVTVDRYDADVSALLDEVARLRRLVEPVGDDNVQLAAMSIGDGVARLHGPSS